MEEISVKLCTDGITEVRRFPFKIPSSGNNNYEGIYMGLFYEVKQFYPTVTYSGLQLFWKDEEGDRILVNTDDELKEALRHRKDGIFRIYARLDESANPNPMEEVEKKIQNVRIGEDVTEEKKTSAETAAEGKSGNETKRESKVGIVHTGVICDGCNQQNIEGVRFKCLICDDYDLCATCDGKHVHDQHPMIRIVNAADRSWMPAFMKVQGIHGQRFAFHHLGGGQARCPFLVATGQNAPGNTGSNGQPQQQQPGQPRQQQEVSGYQFLRDVGQAVAAVLNGFGINVDVDVEHGGQRSKVATTEPDQATEEVKPDATEADATLTEDKPKEQEENVTADIPLVDQPKENAASAPPEEKMGNEIGVQTQTDGQHDWTILDKEEITQQEPTAAPTNPKVLAALNHMMSMGFTNEGGWLTQLLEAKDGNIVDVLEILHPSE